MAIINPTINLVARPGMSLPKPWVLIRDGSDLTSTQLAKVPSGANDLEKKAYASKGTYITATTTLGIETGANKLRHDYSSKKDSEYAGTYNGFLVEAFSENLLMTQTTPIPCRDLTTWTKSPSDAVVVVLRAGITAAGDSDGNNPASKLMAGSSTSASVSKSITGLKANTTYTLSAYFKKVDKSSVAIPKIALSSSGASSITTWGTSRTVSDPYNWILLTYKFTTPASVTSATSYHIGIKASDAPVLVDRVQLEEGNNTSTILETSKVRAAENLYYVGDSDTAKLIDPFEGTVYVMCKVQENVENIPGLKVGICQLGNDTGVRIGIRAESTSSSDWKIYGTLINVLNIADAAADEAASAVFSIANADWPEDDWLKIAVRYRAGESNTIRMSVNGKQVVYGDLAAGSALKSTFELNGITRPAGSANEVTAPIRLGKVYASSSPKTYHFLDGSIMHFAYFPKALSDEDLVAITA